MQARCLARNLKKEISMKNLFSIIILFLSACGSGGGNSVGVSDPVGVLTGTDQHGSTINFMVLPD
jgi:hypothetical protein